MRFSYQHHPHLAERRRQGPVITTEQLPTATAAQRFNTRAAIAITRTVGSMWCAYGFAAFDMISLPSAIRGGASTTVAWVAQTFLQLVLLSIIMVGQDVQSKTGDARAQQTFLDAEAVVHEVGQLQQHLDVVEANQAWTAAAITAIGDHVGVTLPDRPVA